MPPPMSSEQVALTTWARINIGLGSDAEVAVPRLLQASKATRKCCVDPDQSAPSLDSLGAVQNAVYVEKMTFMPTG